MSSESFWAANQVGGPYYTMEESWTALRERQLLYPTLLNLMPIEHPGKIVLDYGCGPGHDTILLCQNGATDVYYYDFSPLALKITTDRLRIHGLSYRAMVFEERLAPVDHIHCAGVLHHTEDPEAILLGFRRWIKPDGEARVMIYDGDRSATTQSLVPITLWWTEKQFTEMSNTAGFDAEYMGGYDCSAPWRPDCVAACYRLTPC